MIIHGCYNASMDCFVLSLPKDTARRERLDSNLAVAGIPSYKIVAGVKVESMDDVSLEEYADLEAYHSPQLKKDPRYVLPVVGCKRALIKLLGEVSKLQHNDWVLCLEDDAILPDKESWDDAMERLKYIPEDCPIVLLWRHHANMGSCDEHCIVTLPKFARGCVAYLIKPAFAKRVVEELKLFGKESDMIWEHFKDKGVPVRMLGCVRTTQQDSNIIGGIPELQHLRHGM